MTILTGPPSYPPLSLEGVAEKAHTDLFEAELIEMGVSETTKLIGLGMRKMLMESVSPHEYPFTYYEGENWDDRYEPCGPRE